MRVEPWSLGTWRARQALQQPEYPDPAAYEAALTQIREYPPLVSVGEVEKLKEKIAAAGQGKAFILQGGNCAERFIDCRAGSIANKLKILLQMSVILTYGVRRPVIRIGRFGGQYAKPRSNEFEDVDGRSLPSYRGDAVNAVEATAEARTADPSRLLSSYFFSATTLNHIRALMDGGFADLHHPYKWNLHPIDKSHKWPEYKHVVERILDAVHFMESLGAQVETLGRVDFFASHEGLLLGYEEALTREDTDTGRHYNLGAHMLWIGARTRQLDGAHVEYFRGIGNPVGVKIDSACTPDELVALLAALNHSDEPGRVTLITRLGADRVEQVLPGLIRAAGEAGHHPVWSCDPMHGNTVTTAEGHKTRDFSVILEEFQRTFRTHKECGSRLAGVHFEMTADDVTECVGGAEALTSHDLHRRYETYCDPRLNASQSLEMAFLIVQLLQTS
ncbi:MAG TPA: 3-deoxy-7-phosphoheptulonate synthase class II [Phycisphaerae bacterium]|nr:3-deoxy-7-phosphoheptulonate synthase class II [Phycisphaerae bacterium]